MKIKIHCGGDLHDFILYIIISIQGSY